MQSDADARTRLLDDSPRMAPSEYSAAHRVPSAFCYFLDNSEDWRGFCPPKRDFAGWLIRHSSPSNRIDHFAFLLAIARSRPPAFSGYAHYPVGSIRPGVFHRELLLAPVAVVPRPGQNSAQLASTKELRLSKSGKTLAREQVTQRPPTLDCGSTHRWIGCVSFIIIIVGTLSSSGGTVWRSGLLVRLHRCPPP